MSEIKALGNGRIGGYGVRFTGPNAKDLQGDYFTPDTNLWIDHYPTVPLMYQHGNDDVLDIRVIGKAMARADPEGVWYEAQLNMRDKYEELIYKLAESGVLGYSSGSLSHLVRREPDGKLLSWPVAELTLTPNPAAGPYLTKVDTLKQAYKSVGITYPEDTVETEEVEETKEVEEVKTEPVAETKTVTPVEKEPEVNEETIKSMIDAKLNDALAPYLEVKSKAVPAKAAPVKEDAVKMFNTFLHTGKAAKALESGTDSEGGYTVPVEYLTELVTGLKDVSIMRAAGARILTVNTDSIKVPTLTNSTAAVLTDEEAAYDAADPSFGQLTFTPYKFTRTVKVSEELVADSMFDLWGQVLAPDFAQAFAAAENSYLTTGTGSSEPAGVVTGSGLGKTTASATAITADEIIDLYHSLGYLYRQNATWMMNDSTIAAIRKLKDGNSQYLWQPGMQAGQPDMILGRPVITNNSMATIAASAKTVLFGDFSYYWIVQRAGMTVDRNPYLYMANGQVGFFARQRVDGKVVLAEAFKHLIQKSS